MTDAYPPELLEITARTGLEVSAMTDEDRLQVRRLLGIKPWEAAPYDAPSIEHESQAAAAWACSLPRAMALRKVLRVAVGLD